MSAPVYSSVQSRWIVQAAQRRRSHHSKTHSSASQLLPVFSTALSFDCFSVSPSCSKFTLLPNTKLKTCSVLTSGHPVGVTVTLQWSLALSSVFTQPPWHTSDAGLSLWKARENCEIGRTAFSLPSQSYDPTFTALLSPSLYLSPSHTHSHTHWQFQSNIPIPFMIAGVPLEVTCVRLHLLECDPLSCPSLCPFVPSSSFTSPLL